MSVGMASGPIVSGGIAEIMDINSVFYFAGIMGLLGTGLFIWFTRHYTPLTEEYPLKQT